MSLIIGDQESLSLIVYQGRLADHSFWITSIPQRLILGLMSPFPWTDIFNVKNPFEFFWYLANYLTAAIGLVCFGTISIFGFLDIRKKILPPVSVVFVMLVAITGIGGSSVHNTYVQIGLFLSFPYVWSRLGKKGAIKYFLFSVVFFVLTSVLWNAIR